jgi:hypothetical protein
VFSITSGRGHINTAVEGLRRLRRSCCAFDGGLGRCAGRSEPVSPIRLARLIVAFREKAVLNLALIAAAICD